MFDNSNVDRPLSALEVKSTLVSQERNALAHPKEAYAAVTPIPVKEAKSIKNVLNEVLYLLKLKKRVYIPDLRQVSKEHGRAVYENFGGNHLLWQDEQGNLYGERDHKGVLMDKSRDIEDDEYGHMSLRVNGMKDGWVLERILTVSDYLAKQGIPSERITEVRKLEQVIDDGHTVDMEEWKQNAIQRYLRNPDNLKGHDQPEKTVNKYMDTDFYALTRDLQVAGRLRDLSQLGSKKDYHMFMEPIVKWYRLASHYKPEHFTPLSPDVVKHTGQPVSEEEMRDFMNRVVPINMGRNLGLTHNLGLAHGWCHAQNYSLVGSYYDVDSIHGEPIGDPLITLQDKSRDFSMTLGAIEETSTSYVQPIVITEAVVNFVTSYMNTTHGQGKWAFDDVESLVDERVFKTKNPYILYGAESEIRAYLSKNEQDLIGN